MSAEAPHPPAPPTPRQILPPFPLLWRGVALLAVAVVLFIGVGELLRRAWWLFPFAIALAIVGVLAAWGGLIEVTGGEKFDDHPWV